MRTTTFTVLDYLPDSLREIPKRRAAELAGAAILAGVAASSLALLSWSVEDPSLNHATSAPIHNWLGKTGAIGADIAMQFIGVACVAALAPPAFWGWKLLTERRLARPRSRLGLALLGTTSAAGFASLLPAPASWPLPTGLGGVVGDAVLWAPLRFCAGSTVDMTIAGFALAGLAILALTASAGYGLAARDAMKSEAPTAVKRRAAARVEPDEDDSDGEPGFALVSIGAAIHTLLMIKSAMRRMARSIGSSRAPRPNRESGAYLGPPQGRAPQPSPP
jgi:DNA segregation ATPase FtsK/SpoIIIE, S-DNA-T family